MGNKTSKPAAADKLYEKMKRQGAYEHITRSWKNTKKLLEKATSIFFQEVWEFMKRFRRSLAVSGVGVGILVLIVSDVVDHLINVSEDIDKVITREIRKIFGEENAHKISGIVRAYVDRCHMFANDKQKLRQEAERYERDLFDQLSRLRSSITDSPQNATTVNLHTWLKGARFHLEILSDMIHLSAVEASQVQRAADLHIQTLGELVAAVKRQKTAAVKLIPMILGVRLIDKEEGRSASIFHPCVKIDAIKDKYLELLFTEQVNSAEKAFKSMAGSFQEHSWAEFSKRFCEDSGAVGQKLCQAAESPLFGQLNPRQVLDD